MAGAAEKESPRRCHLSVTEIDSRQRQKSERAKGSGYRGLAGGVGWRDVARQPGAAVARSFIVSCRGRPRTGRLVVVMRRRHMRRRVLGKGTAGVALVEAVSMAVAFLGGRPDDGQHRPVLSDDGVGAEEAGATRLYTWDGNGVGLSSVAADLGRPHRRSRGGDAVSRLCGDTTDTA